ncbi:MAG: hypothetical protein OXC05_05700 [Halieaceae bacterium]|nr:hypothetical protein [Halieaceae bacterium]
MNRLELSHPEAAVRGCYRQIAADADALGRVLVDLFLLAASKEWRASLRVAMR